MVLCVFYEVEQKSWKPKIPYLFLSFLSTVLWKVSGSNDGLIGDGEGS